MAKPQKRPRSTDNPKEKKSQPLDERPTAIYLQLDENDKPYRVGITSRTLEERASEHRRGGYPGKLCQTGRRVSRPVALHKERTLNDLLKGDASRHTIQRSELSKCIQLNSPKQRDIDNIRGS